MYVRNDGHMDILQVGKEAESDGVLEHESVPGDLKAAAEHIDGVMVSMRKVRALPSLSSL